MTLNKIKSNKAKYLLLAGVFIGTLPFTSLSAKVEVVSKFANGKKNILKHIMTAANLSLSVKYNLTLDKDITCW